MSDELTIPFGQRDSGTSPYDGYTDAEMRKKELNDAKLTLATLCDMVLGEDANDRDDDALVRAVGVMKRERDAAQQSLARLIVLVLFKNLEIDVLASDVKDLDTGNKELITELDAANKRAEQAEHERGEALTKLAEYECDITRLLELFRRQAIRSFIAGARDTYFGLRGESLSSADLKFVSDSAEMRFPYVAESFCANDDIVLEYTALMEKYGGAKRQSEQTTVQLSHTLTSAQNLKRNWSNETDEGWNYYISSQ